MSIVDVTRELHRTRAEHVFIVLTDFFASNPPHDEVMRVVQMIQAQAVAFDSVLTAQQTKEVRNE